MKKQFSQLAPMDTTRHKHVTEVLSAVDELAIKHGADASEGHISVSNGFSVSSRMCVLDKIEHESQNALSITVYCGLQKGQVHTSDLNLDAVTRSVEQAVNLARHVDADEYAGIPPTDLDKIELFDLDLYHPWDIDVHQGGELAVACEEKGFAVDKAIVNSDGVLVGNSQGMHGYFNGKGTPVVWPWSSHFIDATLVAKSGDEMQRSGWFSVSRVPDSLLSIEEIAKEAARRTLSRLHARKLSTRKCAVLFEAPVASGLMAAFVSAVSGGAQYKKNTFLLSALGKKIFADKINIREEPFIPSGLGSCPLDDDGIVPQPRSVVTDGVLQSYFLDYYSAKRLGMSSTGNGGGIHNLIIEPTKDKNFEQMLQTLDTGLLVTDTMGHGVNLLTGDYSQAVSGFWVEAGQIAYPVEEITLAGNLSEMFQNLVEVGSDVDKRSALRTGSILLDTMTLAGS